MKTLALFAIVCLGLVALAAWHLRSISGGVVSEDESPPPRISQGLPPIATSEEIEPSKEPDARSVATADRLAAHGEGDLDSSSTGGPLTAVDEPRAASATQSTVRWASGDEQRRTRQRFIELRDMLADDPHNQAVLEAALELARQLEWHNEACDLLARLVRLRTDDVAVRFELAVQLMRLERWLEAIPQLRFVVEQQPGDERAWYNLAIAHQALGHLRDARITWDRVLELMPENPDAYAHRGEVLLDLRAWKEAAADFATSLRLDPGSLDVTMNLALALAKLGQAGEARDRLLPLLNRHPVHVPLLNRLAELTWTLHQADSVANYALAAETLEYCTRSLTLNDDQPEIKALRDRAAQVAN